MGRNYYYLSASLPTLNFSQHPPLSLESFLAECQKLMVPEDHTKITQALCEQEPQGQAATDVYGRWIVFNHDLKNEMVHFRAKRAGRDPKKYLRGERNPEARLTDAVEQAAKADDPLSAERILDAVRFEYLEQLTSGQHMNFEYLLVYGLKLKMMTRYARIASSSGQEVFRSLQQVDIKLD